METLSALTPCPHLSPTPTLTATSPPPFPTPPHPNPQYRIYASVNWVSIGLDNGLSPFRRQTITWTNVNILSIPAIKQPAEATALDMGYDWDNDYTWCILRLYTSTE